jgi:hypothetical protein
MDALSDPTTATDLYFEKRTDIANAATALGKLEFAGPLNLTNASTTELLQNLGTKMESAAGSMKFDARTATDLKDAGATVSIYRTSAIGYGNLGLSDMTVKDDNGNVLSGGSLPSFSGFATSSSNGGTFMFTASHFTQFGFNPTVTEVSPVTSPTSSSSPYYIFSSNVAGTVVYGGACAMTSASTTIGNNFVTFGPLSPATYSNCTVKVIDGAGASTTLAVSSFEVLDTAADTAAVSADKASLVDGLIQGGNADLSTIVGSLTNPLPSTGSASSSAITWASASTTVVSNDGQTINRPAFAFGDVAVALTATITKGSVSDTKIFNLTVLKLSASTVATVTSATYTVDNGAETITGIPYNTASSTFLAAITKGESHQTWDTSGLSNIIVTGNTLVVTAQDGSTTKAYTLTAALNPAKAITSFTFASPSATGAINEGAHTIAVTVPSGTTVTALVPTIATSTGATVSPASGSAQDFTSPVTYTVTAADSSTQDYTVTVTVSADPIATEFNTLSGDLRTAGIVNNLNTVTGSNYTSFSGLYFEKRTDVNASSTAVGKIIFDGALDLSNSETKTYLQNLGTKMDVSGAGVIGLDFSGATSALSLKGVSATVKFYGLNSLGISDLATGDQVNAKLIAYDDAGNLVDKTPLVSTSTSPTYLGACEVGGGCYVFAVGINHFTKYKIDNTAPTSSITNISAGSSLRGTTTIQAIASDSGSGVAKVEFWYQSIGTKIGEDTTAPYSIDWNTTSAPAGSHDILLRTYDNAGNSAYSSTTAVVVDNDAPTVTKLGNNSADVTISANATTTLAFNEAISSSGKTIVQNALTAGADQTITYAWNASSTILTITGNATSTATFANDVVVSGISDITGNTSGDVLLIDSVLASTETTPDGSGTATVNNTTPQVVITSPSQTANITISSGTTNPQIDVSSFVNGGTGTLPAITITSANANNATVAIPASTTVTSASTTWNGIIAAPTVTTVTLPETSGQTKTLSTAIEVGFSGEKLSFSKAVRILLVGQAGKRAGYIRTGISFTEITNVCAADNQTTGDALAVDSECKIDVGSDLVIWTKHFTSFASYTQTTNSTSSGSSSGGNGIVGTTGVSPMAVLARATSTSSIIESPSEIARLTVILEGLRAQIMAILTARSSSFVFTSDLKLGSRGAGVMYLQRVLNRDLDTIVAQFGDGSANYETTYFGPATRAAVIKFQKKYGISPAAGYVGAITRAKLNEIK